MNLEAIKAAIAWFENQRDGYDDARKRAIANGAMSSTIKSAEIIMTSIDTALAALRECAERREGCEYCREYLEVGTTPDGNKLVVENNNYFNDDEWFCKRCGRKLERSDT